MTQRLCTACEILFFVVLLAGGLLVAEPPQTSTNTAGTSSRAQVTGTRACSSRTPVHQLAVDASGSASDVGRTFEGPLCVDVFYNPIQIYLSLATNTTITGGPDISKVVLGSSAQGGARQAPAPAIRNLPNTVKDLIQREKNLHATLLGIKSNYATTLQEEEKVIAEISLLRRTTLLRSSSQVIESVRNGYKGLKDDLLNALQGSGNFLPTDQPDNLQQIFLNQLQQLNDELSGLQLQFINGTKVDSTPIVCVPDQQHTETRDLTWSDWSAQCKEQVYDPLKARVDLDVAEAKSYIASSDNVRSLKGRIAIVQYWDAIFTDIGLRTGMTQQEIDQADITSAFHAQTQVKCGVLFNQTANTTINLVTADLGPTLEGNDPTIRAQGGFVTVSCASPFSVSAGVAFSTIRQKEFAIVKSSGGPGNPPVNIFGTTSDSKINPMPIGMVHVRLAEWQRHKYAVHGSFGVAGNIQGQSAGGSSAEFLPGVSFSFWRTMYVSVGPHIGTKAELGGGFKEGDIVPAEITNLDGLIKRSRTVGFGFAVTFTKP
jgi:hypothetical protein